MTMASHDDYMRRCIALAQLAPASGDVAVGSLIVKDGAIVAEGIEAVRAREDVAAHAEIEALRAAFGRLGLQISGHAVSTGEAVLPGRRPPDIVRDVLAAECSAVRAQL